jgi:hypothetical protein
LSCKGKQIARKQPPAYQAPAMTLLLTPLATATSTATIPGLLGSSLQDSTSNKQRRSIKQRCQRSNSSSTCTSTPVVCALQVAASARCKPRTGSSTRTGALRFAPAATKGKLRRRRRGSGSGGDDDAGEGYGWHWHDDAAWEQLWLNDFNSNNNNNNYNGGGGSGGSGGWGWSSSSSGDGFQRALQEWLWVWQLLCAASMLQSWYFLLFPRQMMPLEGALEGAAAPDAAQLVRARVGMAY